MKASNKSKTITLVSHYNKQTLRLRLPIENYEILKLYQEEFYYSVGELISADEDLILANRGTFFFSRGQIRKIKGWLSGIDYFDKIEE